MCRSGQQPDGPKTCATDSRNDFADTQAQRTTLLDEHDAISKRILGNASSLDAAVQDEKAGILQRVGVSASRDTSVTDYPVIAERGGDLRAWGFVSDTGDTIATSDIAQASETDDLFIHSLTQEQRTALTTHTTGMYESVNAAYTGRDPNPSDHVRATVEHLDTVFDAHAARNRNVPPVNIVRGTGIPRDWPGGVDDYLTTVFAPGSQIATGKITSLSTSTNVAANWAKRPPLIMVVQTRHGLSVRSFSDFRSEDEIIVAPPFAAAMCASRQGRDRWQPDRVPRGRMHCRRRSARHPSDPDPARAHSERWPTTPTADSLTGTCRATDRISRARAARFGGADPADHALTVHSAIDTEAGPGNTFPGPASNC